MPYGVCWDCWTGNHERCDGRCGCRAEHLRRLPERTDDEEG